MRVPLALKTVRIRNFKAIRDSGTIKFTPLTVFIGNNGSGKSSVVEGLETFQTIVLDGLDFAMDRWHGFEFVRNQAVPRNLVTTDGIMHQTNAMSFRMIGTIRNRLEEAPDSFRCATEITSGPGDNEVFFLRESFRKENGHVLERAISRSPGGLYTNGTDDTQFFEYPWRPIENSIIGEEKSFYWWQFLRLNPDLMGEPTQQDRFSRRPKLNVNGSNIANFLMSILRIDATIVEGIIETLRVVLPYASDVQPVITSEIGRDVYLQLTEEGFKIPSWLFSTGTLRLLALLAVFRHPAPPPLIIIEEIENGFDPRTIHLLVEEMRYAIESGRTQIILTTHSPYLLDLLTLEQIVVVERDASGQPRFSRPSDDDALQKWSEKFSPGKLYTMGRLGMGARK